MGPWAKPGGLLFALSGDRSGSPRSMSFASVGWRYLCDDPDWTMTQNALPPPTRGLATRARRGALRRGEHGGVKDRAVAPQRIQNATETTGERDDGDAPAPAGGELLDPWA